MFTFFLAAYPGASPVSCSAFVGNVGCMELLIAEGADVNACGSHPYKLAPLHSAAMSGATFICCRLVEANADLHQRCSTGRMPEDWARALGHKQLSQDLAALRASGAPSR